MQVQTVQKRERQDDKETNPGKCRKKKTVPDKRLSLLELRFDIVMGHGCRARYESNSHDIQGKGY